MGSCLKSQAGIERKIMAEKLEVKVLADEYRVNVATMAAFVDKFAPCRVPPREYDSRSDIILFVHIPKAVGVSIGQSFQEAFDIFHGVAWDNIPQSFREATQRAIAEQARADVRQVIIGHYGWPELRAWLNNEMDMKCGTVFREPVDRLVSHYHYNTSDKHPAHVPFKNRFPSFESYLHTVDHDVQLNQALGMSSSFQNILQKLTRHYTFLGITENLAASLDYLSYSHGLRAMKDLRKNVGKKGKPSLNEELLDVARRKCVNDTAIHTFLSRIYSASEIT